MDTVRLRMDDSGYVQPRILRAGPAVVVGTSIGARTEAARASVPADLRARFDTLVSTLAEAVTTVQGFIAPRGPDGGPAAPPEPGPELLELEPREVLTDARALNNAIDAWVAGFEESVDGATRWPATHPKGKAARSLKSAFFAEGRRFLAFRHEEQWLAVHQRFNEATAAERQAAALLAIDDTAGAIAALNAFFGRLLGVTEADVEADAPSDADVKEQRGEALSQLLAVLTQCMHFANLAWEGPGSEAARRRKAFLGPYTEAIFELAAARTKKADDDGDATAPEGVPESPDEAS